MAELTPKSARLQKRLLVLSLGLNFVVIGLVAGMFFMGGTQGGAQRFDLTAGPITRAMDTDHREALRTALRESGAFRRVNRQQMRTDVMALLDVVRADTFDETAFKDVLARQRARLAEGQAAVLDALTQQISDMTLDERAAFADRLEEQMQRPAPQRQPRQGDR